MSDGQGKSDDLIAELAKLMASNANGVEAEPKPAPKLVSGSDVVPPAAPSIRVPGMDAPIAAPAPAPVSVRPVTSSAAAAAAPVPTPTPVGPGVLRIPGMDQPVPMAPATPAPSTDTPQAAAPAKTGATGGFSAAAAEGVEDRRLPKFVPVRPATPSEAAAPVVEPVVAPVASRPAPVVQAPKAVEGPAPVAAEPAPAPTRIEPVASAAEPVKRAADDFHFDFGFSTNPPAQIGATEPRQPVAAPVPVPAASAEPVAAEPVDDPIAELIAAELEGAGASPGQTAEPVPPLAAAPTVTAGPQLSAQRAPVQPPAARPVNPVPVQPQRSLGVQPQVRPPMPVPVPARPTPFESRASVPVFGAPTKSQPAPSAERDPMEEIESLIGEAVRVELAAPEKPAKLEPIQVPQPSQQPAPSVPPLSTGMAMRRATIRESSVEVPSAEAAILAAAAATGAEVGRIDTSFAGEVNPYKRPKAKPERRGLLQGGLRQYVGMAVAGTLLLAAGFGLYWVLGMNRSADTEAPVLTADTTPVKEPPPAVPAPSATQGSVVFGELDGNTAEPADEQLVSRDDSTSTSVADVAQPVGEEATPTPAGATPAPTGESELANRKVRTVTVRPDGTIVSGDDAVAGSEELPVERPNVPAIPGADLQQSDLLAALPTNDATSPTPAVANDTPTDAIGALAASDGTSAIPPADAAAATVDPSIVAPIPMARPSDRSILGGGANQRVAATPAPLDLVPSTSEPFAQASAPQAAAPQASAPQAAVPQSSGSYVQLSSQPTEADAQASLQRTQNQLSSLLGGRSLAVRQVDLGAKGVWYRVVLPVSSFQEATQTCASLKANGTDCVAING